MYNKISYIAVFLLSMPATNALAQAQSNANIDQRVRTQNSILSENDQLNSILGGDTDLVLLRLPKLFNAHMAISSIYSDNASLSADTIKADTIGQMNIGILAQTTIANRYNISADLSLNTTKYQKLNSLDYNALTFSLGAQTQYKNVQFAATYQYSDIYDGSFVKRQLRQQIISLNIAKNFRYNNINIEPRLSIERTISDPKDYNNWSGGPNIAISMPISTKHKIAIYTDIGYVKREYDSYFRDLLGVSRNDDNWTANIGLSWQFNQIGTLSLSYSYNRNDSTSDVNRFEANSGNLNLRISKRF